MQSNKTKLLLSIAEGGLMNRGLTIGLLFLNGEGSDKLNW